MVRATVAFAVVALGAAAVLAQAPEGTTQLEARDFNNDLELREYAVDDLEAREYEELVDMEARDPNPEFFDDIEAREYEADELVARNFEEEELEARAEAPVPNHPPLQAANAPPPSQTVTVTNAPTPTSCTKKELKALKEREKVKKAIAFLKSVKGKKDLSSKEKKKVKKAKKFLSRVKRRKTKAAKRLVKKCSKALRKAGLTVKDCQGGADCASALTGKGISAQKCEAAAVYLQRIKDAKKAKKEKKSSKKSKKDVDSKESEKSKKSTKSEKSAKKSTKSLAASKTTSSVGPDGITTVTVNAPGPTCTAASSDSKSKLSKKLVAREIVDEEFESVFAREYDVDELD